MIQEEFEKKALQAINDVLVVARAMAHEEKPHAELAKLLDAAEELPLLIARDQDMTREFREALDGLASKYPELKIALETFDRGHASSRA